MALFLAIVALSIASVVPFLLFTNFNGVGIISSYRGIVFPVSLFLLFLKILSFFICARGLSELSRLRAGWSGVFTLSQLCFLGPRLLGAGFFGSGPLGLHL